jgi:hypothetical protein
MKLLIALLSTFLLGSSAYCEGLKQPTGMDLLRWIRTDRVLDNDKGSYEDIYDRGSFSGRISMVFTCGENHFFSAPDRMTTRQVIATIRQYLSDHPERLDMDANLLIVESLMKAYPLSKEGALKSIAGIKTCAGVH